MITDRIRYTPHPQPHLQSLIDDAMHRVEGVLSRVLIPIRRQRNSMSPVSSLPPEVLTDIFSYGTLADTLRVSWVSSAWRAVAINSPSLWKRFDLDTYRNPNLKD